MSDQSLPDGNFSNDVQVIRNILFGEHLEGFQKRIEVLEKELAATQKENKTLRNLIENEGDKASQELHAYSKQVEGMLGQLKIDQSGSLEGLRKDTVIQLNDLAAQFKKLNQRLASQEERQDRGDGLIASIVNLLAEYQKNAGK